jgi:hypothetical protein
MKVTRHAAMSISDAEVIPDDKNVELEQEISDFPWPLLGDFQQTYSPFTHRCQNAIYEDLYEIDPMGIR